MNNCNFRNMNLRKPAEFIHVHTKLVIITLAAIISLSTIIFGVKDYGMKADASSLCRKYFTCITIEEGDTLTDIAYEYISDDFDSIQAYIDEVKSINNLDSDNITSGATLVVPYYAEPIATVLQ